jgi:creatinine amidohydrolase
VRPGWIIEDLKADGAVGNAAAAAEKGEALLASAARNFAAFMDEFTRFDHRAASCDPRTDGGTTP